MPHPTQIQFQLNLEFMKLWDKLTPEQRAWFEADVDARYKALEELKLSCPELPFRTLHTYACVARLFEPVAPGPTLGANAYQVQISGKSSFLTIRSSTSEANNNTTSASQPPSSELSQPMKG